MDQKNLTSSTTGEMNPPPYSNTPYTPYAPQQQHSSYFPPSEQFGQSQTYSGTSTGSAYPYEAYLQSVQSQPLSKDLPYPPAPVAAPAVTGQVTGGGDAAVPPASVAAPASTGQEYGGGGAAIPPVGFYIPPSQPQRPINHSDDEEPKFTAFHNDIAGYAFSEKSIRMAFIRKVFGILSVQMLITSSCIGLFLYHEGLQKWTMENPWFLWVVLGVYIVTACMLICCQSVQRTAPGNYIFLGIFTFATSIVVGAVCSTYQVDTVLLAAGITVVVCVSLTIFAFQTKIDFTRMSGILFVMLIVLLLFGIMTIFLRAYFPVLRMVYSALGALLFSAYLVHDVQMLVGGHHKQAISPEDYVFAALTIYLDIINIFLYLLRLLGQKN